MTQDTRRWTACLLGVLAVLPVAMVSSALAAPVVPSHDSEVLERLRSTTAADPRSREIRELQADLARQPDRRDLAVRVARLYLLKNREESDPRYLGYAQAALARWWSEERAPSDVVVLRATIRQSRHEFEAAMGDLSRLVAVEPGNAQGWLTLAAIQQVRGDYAAAGRSAMALFQLADEEVAVTCAAITASLNGEAAKGANLLQRTLGRNPHPDPAVRVWALTALAEITGRLGRDHDAEARFKEALALQDRDGYLLGAYADFLLDVGRPEEVLSLLREETRNDNLLLRLGLAEQGVHPTHASLSKEVTSLRARFEASRLRGDTAHQREEARFTLHLLHQPRPALDLARANWQVQREPADVRILLEAAIATGDQPALHTVREWLQTSRLEDVHLDRLLASRPGSQAAVSPRVEGASSLAGSLSSRRF